VVHQAHAGTRWLTTTRAVSVPLTLNTSTQSLSTMPGLGVVFRDPHVRAAARQRQHAQVVGVGAVDAPLLVRGDEVQHDLGVAVGLLAQHRLTVLVSIGGLYARPSPKSSIQR
jgi:hypothetical protein